MHAAAAGAVAHLPVHAEAIGDGGDAGLQRRQIDGEVGGVEHHPHEEMAGLHVVELLGVEDVLPVMGKERRHRGYDAGAVRTGQCQYELMIGHGAGLTTIQAWNGDLWPCSITRGGLAPIPPKGS